MARSNEVFLFFRWGIWGVDASAPSDVCSGNTFREARYHCQELQTRGKNPQTHLAA